MIQVMDAKPESLQGSKNGYEYYLLQSFGPRLVYVLKNPNEEQRLVIVDSHEDVQEFTSNPGKYWSHES